jgi:cytochrome b
MMALVVLAWVETFMDVGMLKSSLTRIHVALGLSLTVGFTLRAIWGIVGPKQARWDSLLKAALRGLSPGRSTQSTAITFGYDTKAAIVYVALYVMISIAVLSGLLLSGIRYDQGPFASALFDELAFHEFLFNLHTVSLYGASLFFLVHLAGMIRHEAKSGIPVAQSMISGYQYQKIDEGNDKR